MLRILPVAAAAAIVIAAGIVHGFWTDRWGVTEAVAAAASSLDRVPRSIGDWQAQPLDSDQTGAPELAGQLYLRYVNRKTLDSVSIALVCGRPGPVCIHTPDVCYERSGHTIGKITLQEVKLDKSTAHLFTMEAKKEEAAEQTRLRIFWCWFDGSRWNVADNPRATYAGRKALFKFYVVREVTNELPLDQDPCLDFLRQFLPEAQKALEGGSS
jgi:Protein of unknown function (DUF3485)